MSWTPGVTVIVESPALGRVERDIATPSDLIKTHEDVVHAIDILLATVAATHTEHTLTVRVVPSRPRGPTS